MKILNNLLHLHANEFLCVYSNVLLRSRSHFSTTIAVGEVEQSASVPIVQIPELGALQGCITESSFTKRKIYQFLGINYAESPTGSKRFKAPIPTKSWTGVKLADKYGRIGPNYKSLAILPKDQIDDQLEDYLNLCVYTNDFNTKKPVMFYVHGGGFIEGGANQYPPNYLLEKDIVLVVPQYRLGPLGFLSTKSEAIPGNAAVLDVILALQWVQKYIKYFGGDENNVTLAGQSAGAAIASAINLSPNVPDDLFHKLIFQSGSSISTWCWDDRPIENAKRIAKNAGINTKNIGVDELNEYFMNMDVLTLLKSFHKHLLFDTLNGTNTIGGNRLTIGGPTNLLPVNAYELFKNNTSSRNLPLLTGACRGDAGFAMCIIYDLLRATRGVNDKQFNKYHLLDFCTRIMGVEDLTGGLIGLASLTYFTQDQLNRGDFGEMSNGLLDFINSIIIKGPVLRQAQHNAKFQPNNTFLYSFDYMGEHTRYTDDIDPTKYPYNPKICHSDDNIYLFPYNLPKPNENDRKIVEKMVNLWTSFMEHGIPITETGQPNWPPLTNVTGPYFHINSECTIGRDFTDEYTVNSRAANEPKFSQLK